MCMYVAAVVEKTAIMPTSVLDKLSLHQLRAIIAHPQWNLTMVLKVAIVKLPCKRNNFWNLFQISRLVVVRLPCKHNDFSKPFQISNQFEFTLCLMKMCSKSSVCGYKMWKFVIDGGELTRNINQKKTSGILQACRSLLSDECCIYGYFFNKHVEYCE